MTSAQVIRLLGLRPLEFEGGWFRETWRDKAGTAIYYLLTVDTCSRLHRLSRAETWHFYLGDPVTLLLLHPDGRAEEVVLGPDIERGQQLQRTVPAGTWQGARIKEKARAKCQEPRVISCAEEGEGRVAKGERWALMGTTVAPPFDRAGFEAGVRAALLLEYPAEREAIVRLTTEEA